MTEYRAMELLQVTATIAAIALALATLTEVQGPQVRGVYMIPLTLLISGFFALVGSLYAIEDLREEITSIPVDWAGTSFLAVQREALFFALWAIRLVGFTYLWLLVDIAP